MSVFVIGLVLGSAFLHASWNAMLKNGADKDWWQTAFCMVAGLASALVLPFVVAPAPASWPYIAASVAVHVIYNLLLVRMYASGDFGQSYPIARGSSPMLVALGSFVAAGEVLTPLRIAGVLMVSGGIFALAFQGRRVSVSKVPIALAIGFLIATYSVIDGVGARLSGDAIGYSAWMFLIWAVIMIAIYVAHHGVRNLLRGRDDMMNAAAGGMIGATGYVIVIWAMTVTQMGAVSALRETSVVFAALLARFFLKEQLTLGRLSACIVIAGGGALLGA